MFKGGYSLIDCGTGDYTVLCDESFHEKFIMNTIKKLENLDNSYGVNVYSCVN
jgi:hypothetical protein